MYLSKVMKMQKGRKDKHILGKMMIFATIILLTVGSIAPLITARSQIDVKANLFSHPRMLINKQLVQVQVSRWTEDNELVTSIEFWPQYKVDAYRVAMEKADTIDGQHFTVLKQYGLIPQDKTQDDLSNFYADQYIQNKQISKEFEKHAEKLTFKSGSSHIFHNAVIWGEIYAPFFCFRIPFISYVINSDNGGEIEIEVEDMYIPLSGNRYFDMFIFIWVGMFFPPVRNGINHMNKGFSGLAGYISIAID